MKHATSEISSTTKISPKGDSESERKILIITYTMTSHVYATAKMARLLLCSSKGDNESTATKTKVDYALPDHGPSLELAKSLLPSQVTIRRVGTVSTKKQMNVRTVTDPLSWKTLWNSLRNPFPFAEGVNNIFDEQDGMYEPLKRLIRYEKYDCIITIHSACITVVDVLESLQLHDQFNVPPLMILSSLPYDPSIQTDEWAAWKETRTITAFPHVCIYPSRPSNLFQWISMRFWQALDTFLVTRAWKNSTPRSNERRTARGLPPVTSPWTSYLRRFPTLCFGGVAPFGEYHLPSNVTCIGSLDIFPEKSGGISQELYDWLNKNCTNDENRDENNSCDGGVIYIGFGTGTTLSDEEAIAFSGGLLKFFEEEWTTTKPTTAHSKAHPKILFALRSSEIERLEPIISHYLGQKPTYQTNNRVDYGPSLRIEADLPQELLLKQPQVGLFISHMGMGGFTEAIAGAAPLLCYPSGLDQYYNTQRAVEAGVGERIIHVRHLPEQFRRVWKDPLFISAAKKAQQALVDAKGNDRSLAAIDNLIICHNNEEHDKLKNGSVDMEKTSPNDSKKEGRNCIKHNIVKRRRQIASYAA
mmetsp:Transcript_43024/g.104048  ORF Transcript_43024/g.104048 Transcript_43024/m.104048 type:complete len:586 (-) Transcript_43024:13-1770(-)